MIPFIPFKDRIVIEVIEQKQKGQIITPNTEKGFIGLERYEDHPFMGRVIAVAEELSGQISPGEVLMLDSFDVNRVEHINIMGKIYTVIKIYQVVGKRTDLAEPNELLN